MDNLIESFPEEMKIKNGVKIENSIIEEDISKVKKSMRMAKAGIITFMTVGVFFSGIMLTKYIKDVATDIHEKKEIEALMKKEEEDELARLDRVANNKVAYLTFDDGPNSNTKKVLDILSKNNIKATFFLVGDMVKNNPDIVRDIYEDGHTIANHTMSHSYKYNTEDEFIDEIEELDSVISEIIGKEYKSLFVRVPGGSMGKTLEQEALVKNGLKSINWTGLIGDSEKANANKSYLLKRAKETIGDNKYEVVLMHDVKSVTADNLQEIIDYIKEEGYIFEPLVEDSPVYFK